MSLDVVPRAPARRRPSRLAVLLVAGITDSVGLAFGWTVFLLAVTARDGLDAGAVLLAAMLLGVGLSAPFCAALATHLSPRAQLRRLAISEAGCRLAAFLLLMAGCSAASMAPLVVLMNVLAWSGFAAMRAEAARTEREAGGGRSLTWYAVSIAGSEALAAAAASVLIGSRPSTALLAATAAVYAGALVPQWLAGAGAPAQLPARTPNPVPLRLVAPVCGLGGITFLLAAGPALMATVLAFELYGRLGVVVSAVCFAACSLMSARLQAVVGRWVSAPRAAFGLGVLLVGGWALSGAGLAGLAVAQGLAGLAQCSLEGDLDARVVARLGPDQHTAGLALASSSRALGGAVSVGSLPLLLAHVPLPAVCAVAAGVLVTAHLAGSGLHRLRTAAPIAPVSGLAG